MGKAGSISTVGLSQSTTSKMGELNSSLIVLKSQNGGVLGNEKTLSASSSPSVRTVKLVLRLSRMSLGF